MGIRANEKRPAMCKAPSLLGVRLETDFDAFFLREDATEQLQCWREARLILTKPIQFDVLHQRRASRDDNVG